MIIREQMHAVGSSTLFCRARNRESWCTLLRGLILEDLALLMNPFQIKSVKK